MGDRRQPIRNVPCQLNTVIFWQPALILEVEKSDYNLFKEVGEVSLRFMWAIGKTIK